jgi:hypothetical protein
MPPFPLEARIIVKENGKSILPLINQIKSLYSGRRGMSVEDFSRPFQNLSSESPLMAAATELEEILTSPIEFHGMKSNFSLFAPAEYTPASSIAHLDMQYVNTPDFLMLPDAIFMPGLTLDEMIAIRTRNGTLSPLCIYGPRMLDLLETIGWQVYNSDGTSFSPPEPHRIEFYDDIVVDFKKSATKEVDSPTDTDSDPKSEGLRCSVSNYFMTILAIAVIITSSH